MNFSFADRPLSNSYTRRSFLRTGTRALAGLAVPAALTRNSWAASIVSNALGNNSRQSKSVIFLYLAGGPSHLDMYDTKPGAPLNIRGEFRPIRTVVPGMQVCEHLPLHAKIADKFAIVNGVETVDTHSFAVIASGSMANQNSHGLTDLPAVSVRTPSLPHGDWDTHGRVLGRKLSIFAELREKLPAYDALVHELITDIYRSGRDQDVLLVACGEFGRTPWINKHGGRDHWAPCGSVLFAGGGLRMGQAVGNTGPIGEREQSRSQPYTAGNVLATIYRHLGVAAPQLEGAAPIAELV
jgi:hypothetical protein